MKTNKYGFNRYLYDEGKFSFDGNFNVIELEKDTSMYHGSVSMAYYNYEFPIMTKGFYEPKSHLTSKNKALLQNNTRSYDEQMRLIYKRLNPSHCWMGNIHVAQNYSSRDGVYGNAEGLQCSEKCVHAYKSIKKLRFVDMSDPFNVMVIVKHHSKYFTPKQLTQFRKNLEFSPNLIRKKNWKHRNIFYNQTEKSYRGYHPLHRITAPIGSNSTRSSGEYSHTPEILIKIGRIGFTGERQ